MEKSCTKFTDFDEKNPNYEFLRTALEEGRITLIEDRCVALINAAPLELKFGLGMSAYLESQGYTAFVAYAYFPQGE